MNDRELIGYRSTVDGCDGRLSVDFFGVVYWAQQEVGFISHNADMLGKAKAIERECLALERLTSEQGIAQKRERFKRLLQVADGLQTPRVLLCLYPSVEGMKIHTESIHEELASDIDSRIASVIDDLITQWSPEHPSELTQLILTREGAEDARSAAMKLFDWASQYFATESKAYSGQLRRQFQEQIDTRLEEADFPGVDEIANALLGRIHVERPRQ
jgi:hypothetical protein